jgi:hypothetical protein
LFDYLTINTRVSAGRGGLSLFFVLLTLIFSFILDLSVLKTGGFVSALRKLPLTSPPERRKEKRIKWLN